MANKYTFGNSGHRSRIPILGFFVEVVVIVLGIYIAFTVEKWNDGKKEKLLEQKYLTELLEEVKINWTELEADQDFRRVQEEYLLKLMDNRNRQVDTDTINKALQLLTTFRFYSPTTAVYDDLISSGNLSIIKSDSIRYLILTDKQRRSRAPATEMSERNYIENQLVDFLIEKRAYSLLSMEENLAEIQVSERDARLITSALLRDSEFYDHVYARLTRLQSVLYFSNPIQWNLRALRTKLQEELESKE